MALPRATVVFLYHKRGYLAGQFLLTVHLGHPLILFLLYRYGPPGLNGLMDAYGRGRNWLRDRVP